MIGTFSNVVHAAEIAKGGEQAEERTMRVLSVLILTAVTATAGEDTHTHTSEGGGALAEERVCPFSSSLRKIHNI